LLAGLLIGLGLGTCSTGAKDVVEEKYQHTSTTTSNVSSGYSSGSSHVDFRKVTIVEKRPDGTQVETKVEEEGVTETQEEAHTEAHTEAKETTVVEKSVTKAVAASYSVGAYILPPHPRTWPGGLQDSKFGITLGARVGRLPLWTDIGLQGTLRGTELQGSIGLRLEF
jgi:hypothetical protein